MELGDILKHYGVKGMKWDESKVDQYEQQMNAFIKKHKLSPKQVAEIKARVRKLKLEASKGAKSAKKKATKSAKKLVKGAKKQVAKYTKPEVKKYKKYTVDFKKQNDKKVKAANDALSKKRTVEGHKQQKQMAEDKYWKNRTKEGRKEMKDHAVNDHFDKIRKAKEAKAANKDKAVNEHYKKVRKAESDKKSRKSAKEKATNAYYKKLREKKDGKPKSKIDKVVDSAKSAAKNLVRDVNASVNPNHMYNVHKEIDSNNSKRLGPSYKPQYKNEKTVAEKVKNKIERLKKSQKVKNERLKKSTKKMKSDFRELVDSFDQFGTAAERKRYKQKTVQKASNANIKRTKSKLLERRNSY